MAKRVYCKITVRSRRKYCLQISKALERLKTSAQPFNSSQIFGGFALHYLRFSEVARCFSHFITKILWFLLKKVSWSWKFRYKGEISSMNLVMKVRPLLPSFSLIIPSYKWLACSRRSDGGERAKNWRGTLLSERLEEASLWYAVLVTWSERASCPFVFDTSPKCIDREGLGRRRTGTGQRPQQCRYTIDHFTVVDLVSWPLSGREAEVYLVLILTSFLFLWKLCLKIRS